MNFTLGHIAYSAYAKFNGIVTQWEELPTKIQEHWEGKTEMSKIKPLGQIAFEAYAKFTSSSATWDTISLAVQQGWNFAANEVVETHDKIEKAGNK